MPSVAGVVAGSNKNVPPWPVTPNREEITRALSALNNNEVLAQTVTRFGSLSSDTFKWHGGVLAPNGMIYGIPTSATSVLKINPTNDTVSTFGSLTAEFSRWFGGVLAPNGFIYGIPYTASTVLKINPTNDTAATFGSVTTNGAKWAGGVLAPNGFIYGIPYNSTTVLKINPTNDTTSTFGSLTGTAKWWGGVLGLDGMIYGIPFASSTILKINPTNDTTSTFGSYSGSNRFNGGVITARTATGEERIYIANSGVQGLHFIRADLGSTASSTLTNTAFSGAALGGEGNAYFGSGGNLRILKIDRTAGTSALINVGSGSGNSWAGGTLAFNGSIYWVPRDATGVVKIATKQSPDPNLPLTPYLNKL